MIYLLNSGTQDLPSLENPTYANFTYFLAYILEAGVRWRGDSGAMRLIFARKVESKYVLKRYKTWKQNISTRWC